MRYEDVPERLRALPQWICHKAKEPKNARNGNNASSTNPKTWTDFETAVQSATARPDLFDGIGFVFTPECGIVGVDLDTVRDPDTGKVDPLAEKIIKRTGSYTEVSPSGYGFHTFLEAPGYDLTGDKFAKKLNSNKNGLPGNGIRRIDEARTKKQGHTVYKDPEVEFYNSGRYFTVTGDRKPNTSRDIQERSGELKALRDDLAETLEPKNKPQPKTAPAVVPAETDGPDDSDYMKIGLAQDPKLISLWNGDRPHGNESADDQALMNKLAYWSNCNKGLMIDYFLSSPHADNKDAKHAQKAQRQDYLDRTAEKAIRDCGQTAREKDQIYKTKNGRAAIALGRPTKTNLETAIDFMSRFTTEHVCKDLLKFNLDDLGNAARFMYANGFDVFYSPLESSWYLWDGIKWNNDKILDVNNRIIETILVFKNTAKIELDKVEQQEAEAKTHGDRELAKKFEDEADSLKKILKFASQSSNRSRLQNALLVAQSAKTVEADKLDADKHLLTCANGTVDLRTGAIRPTDREDYITKASPIAYDPDAKAPVFLGFLDKIFAGNAELIEYIQIALGYSITGETREQCFFILHGSGSNGKTTLIEAVRFVIPDHTVTVPTVILMVDRKGGNGGGATPELAKTAGARIVVASESEDYSKLNENKVKQLTGSDMISARKLYSDGFEFKPQFKILLCTNHMPKISGTDLGIWRRIRKIPFDVTIPEEEQDPTLSEKLEAEAPGILAWLIQGAVKYYKAGRIKTPECVREATDEYRQDQDIYGSFLECCTEEAHGLTVSTADLYEVYRGYAIRTGEGNSEISSTKFTRDMKARGMKTIRKTMAGTVFTGMALSKYGLQFLNQVKAF